jgi:hypothetical protein
MRWTGADFAHTNTKIGSIVLKFFAHNMEGIGAGLGIGIGQSLREP